jgi:hypothetical protein
MRKANSSMAYICGANLSARTNRGFSWVACATTESFPKVLPKLLLFAILFSLAGFFPSVYAGNYVPGTCPDGKDNPTDACVATMGIGSIAYLTYQDQANHQYFDCSNPHPDCTYPNTNLYDPRGPWYCWSANQMGINMNCLIAACPVLPLTQPPFSDACSTSLEAGKGKDVNNKCDPLREDMRRAANCIADKINKLSSPPIKPKYTTPSATVRTEAYQNHLLEIWTKSQQLDTIMNSVVYTPETKQACAATYAAVLAEKQAHGIDAQPSSSGDEAPHVERRAIDVPRRIANALMDQVTIEATTVDSAGVETTTITSDVEDYIHSATVNPPACDSNISWGGRFKHYDPVHFQLP